MWNVRSCVDIHVVPDIPRPAQRLWSVSQMQQRSFPRALRHLCPSLHRSSWQPAISPGASLLPPCWAGKGWRTPGPGLPGLAAMSNAQQLAPVNIPAEALNLMGNPNGDLFIKTISWLFVVPASHEGATRRPGFITSSFGSSVCCTLIYASVSDYILRLFYKLTFITTLMMHHVVLSLPPWAVVFCPTFPLLFNLQLPISLPFPPPLSWVHPHAVTLNLNI